MAKKRALLLKTVDTFGKRRRLQLNEVNKSFQNASTSATAANIDTAMRALNNLTTNTYGDTVIVEQESVNEILAEEEGD